MGSARRASRREFGYRGLAALLALTGCGGAAGYERAPIGGNNGVPANLSQAAAPNSPLTGLWSQTSAPCAAGMPAPARVEELEFEVGGRFLVSFAAFETYHDYWGPWRYDAASGALGMNVERGNAVPGDLDLDGRATIAPNGELVLEGISFGTPRGSGPEARDCVLRFTRRR